MRTKSLFDMNIGVSLVAPWAFPLVLAAPRVAYTHEFYGPVIRVHHTHVRHAVRVTDDESIV